MKRSPLQAAWKWIGVIILVGLILALDWRRYWPLAALIAFVALLLATVLVFPSVVATRDVGDAEPGSGNIRNDVRTALLQGFASIMLLVGAGFAFNQLRTSQRELQTSAKGQQTERFSRAVEQLATDNDRAVQLGGIFTLIDIAKIDSGQRDVVAKILAAYVQEHAFQPTEPLATPGGAVKALTLTKADLQACLDFLADQPSGDHLLPDLLLDGVVLPGLSFGDGQAWLEKARLRDADLTGASMVGGRLAGADLTGAKLSGSRLHEADLSGAQLAGARLENSDLSKADLERADMTGANLHAVDLHSASLRDAVLIRADLSSARHLDGNLAGADLRHAKLEAADLRFADNLLDADLTGATCDGRTLLPETVECNSGVVLVKR